MSSDGVKDTSLKAKDSTIKATAKDFTYKATGNKIKIKQQSIRLQLLYCSESVAYKSFSTSFNSTQQSILSCCP